MTDNNQNSREQFYQHISGQNLTPLWESLHLWCQKRPTLTVRQRTGIIRRSARCCWRAAA